MTRRSRFGLSAVDGEPGGRLVTPLRLEDGRVILVDRGWLPEPLLPPNVPRRSCQPAGPVTLEGIGRWRGGLTPGWMAPDNAPAQRRWFSWDIPAMEADARAAARAGGASCSSSREGPAGLPEAEPVTIDFPNDHLAMP